MVLVLPCDYVYYTLQSNHCYPTCQFGDTVHFAENIFIPLLGFTFSSKSSPHMHHLYHMRVDWQSCKLQFDWATETNHTMVILVVCLCLAIRWFT